MNIDFQNFFKYYDENLKHHVEAVNQLEAAITKLDPALIGGLQVRIGDDVYDASVSAHLKRIAGEI